MRIKIVDKTGLVKYISGRMQDLLKNSWKKETDENSVEAGEGDSDNIHALGASMVAIWDNFRGFIDESTEVKELDT